MHTLTELHGASERPLLDRTAELRTGVLDLLEAASGERPTTDDSVMLVTHLQGVANDLGVAERMLLHTPELGVAA